MQLEERASASAALAEKDGGGEITCPSTLLGTLTLPAVSQTLSLSNGSLSNPSNGQAGFCIVHQPGLESL
jgi:hypothetical protein